MHQHGPQNAFAQPRPAPLVFELADHLQQFVGVVVHPARAARLVDAGRFGAASSPGSSGSGRFARLEVARGERVQPRIDPVIEVPAQSCPFADWLGGSLGSFTSAGASLVGIACDGAFQGTRSLWPAPYSIPLCLFSHFGRNPGARTGSSPVQWFLLN